MNAGMLAAPLFGALVVTAPPPGHRSTFSAWTRCRPSRSECPKRSSAASTMTLQESIADGKLAGTVVLVARKGKLVYADAAGFQDKDEGKPMALD